MAVVPAAPYVSNGRDGRAFSISVYGLLQWKKYDGDEKTTPPHKQLLLECKEKPEGIVVGGGAVLNKGVELSEDGEALMNGSLDGAVHVSWKSGTFQFGEVLKTAFNETAKEKAMSFRDLAADEEGLGDASAEVGRKMAELWGKSEHEVMASPVSEASMISLRAAATRLHERVAAEFCNVDVLEAYKDEITKMVDGGEALFRSKGAASALTACHLQDLLSRLPAVCNTNEVDFAEQFTLFKTAHSCLLLAKVLAKCQRVEKIYLYQTGMSDAALSVLAQEIPHGLPVTLLSLSSNPNMLVTEEGIDALAALVSKFPSLSMLRVSATGYVGDTSALKQRIRANLANGERVRIYA